MQIRDVPETVRDDLTNEARRHGQSLQSYLRDLLTREAKAAARRRWLEEARGRVSAAPREPGPTATELVRQYRDRETDVA